MTQQIISLFLLAIPIACVAWTVTREEIFIEFRSWCVKHSKEHPHLIARKFCYLFTCEYCFSHWVTAAFLFVTRFHLLYSDWRGYLLAFYALPFIANFYMGHYAQAKLNAHKIRHQNRILESSQSGQHLLQ